MPSRIESSPDRIGHSMRTFTMRHFWPLDPRPEEVCIVDIAHALACTSRYGGHFPVPYSVAQHSCLVSDTCEPEHALIGLMHDAAEAYCGDLIKPIKADPNVHRVWAPVERLCHEVIAKALGFPVVIPDDVDRADHAACELELRTWSHWHESNECVWGWLEAESRFLQRFHNLQRSKLHLEPLPPGIPRAGTHVITTDPLGEGPLVGPAQWKGDRQPNKRGRIVGDVFRSEGMAFWVQHDDPERPCGFYETIYTRDELRLAPR